MVAFSFGAMQLSLFAFLVTYLVERVGLDLVTAGVLFAVMQGAGVVARIGWGWVSDRWVPARPLLAMLGIGTIASTLAAAASPMPGRWPGSPASVSFSVSPRSAGTASILLRSPAS